MKKNSFHIIGAFTVLIVAILLIPQPSPTGVRLAAPLSATSQPVVVRQGADTTGQECDSLIEEELNYYLDRHNVQDEGYELVTAFAGGHHHEVNIDGPVPVWNIGRWQGLPREGVTIATDTAGRTLIGISHADTLTVGYRMEATGTYAGDFSRGVAQGHGAFYQADGGYFEGRWENDLRHGFGLQLQHPRSQAPRLRVGEWSHDRFKGERMRYTSERIYGIDIARYQHEKGRKRHGIQWQRLRITHLGKNGSRNVNGTADYPVSFVYIKSTEGTNIRNRYYANDYRKAREHGIHTGAYHFFSTRTSGADQARFFLRNTRFSDGDLPPVLDVEPSDAQIRQMGGIDSLFGHIRVWLTAVAKATGVRPILYINQMFVNKYLSLAPDLKHDYRVWVARYGEYKPDLRLTYWQLCADGRVAGIHGEVDINVFNGYKNQFEDFLHQETITNKH